MEKKSATSLMKERNKVSWSGMQWVKVSAMGHGVGNVKLLVLYWLSGSNLNPFKLPRCKNRKMSNEAQTFCLSKSEGYWDGAIRGFSEEIL